MRPACAWRLISSPSIARSHPGYGHSASPPFTVPVLWSLIEPTISNEQRFAAGSGTTRTPVPSGASRQFGDSGTRPSQYGQRIVRAHRYPSTRFPSGSAGKIPAYFGSAISINRAASRSNASRTSNPKRIGASTVWRSSSAATEFRSFASVSIPRRTASNGMLPPPAVGSRTIGDATPQRRASERSQSRSALVGECENARG